MPVRPRWNAIKIASTGAAALILVACEPTATPTGPTARSVRVASLNSWIPQISVTAEDGTVLTLNLQDHELQIGNGDIYDLSPSQELDLVNRFYAMNAMESRMNELAQGTPGGGPGISAASLPVGGGLGLSIDGGMNPPASNGVQFRKASAGTPLAPSNSGQTLTATLPGGGLASADYPFSCLDMANAIANLMPAYRVAKGAYIASLIAVAKSFIKFDDFWVPHWKVPGPTAVIASDVAASTLMSVSIQLNFITGLYRAQGCMAGDWASAPSIAGSRYILECHSEPGWEISVDGGATWQSVGAPVTVCEIVAA